MGRFDWRNWVMGLVAAFLGGGSGAIGAAFSTMVIAPQQFNLQNPSALLKNMGLTFLFSGLIAFFAKLHTDPVPTMTTTVTETRTPPGVVKTTVTKVEESSQ